MGGRKTSKFSAKLNRMKILYVDDEQDLLELASTFFEDEKLPLDTAVDVPQAIELIRKNTYDVIIADVRMPSGNGMDLVKRARDEFGFKGRCILASGDVKIEEARSAGCDHVVNKPIDFFALIDTIRELLQSK